MSETLLRRPLVFVAHQDDETIGCAIPLQRATHATVVWATDGAPQDEFFWKKYGSRGRLAAIRKDEARAAMRVAAISGFHFLDFPDQELHLHWRAALELLMDIARQTDPTVVVTHAYEGGHPDHDTCSFIAAEAGRELGVDVWEMPLYYHAGGGMVTQKFITGDADITFAPTERELACKHAMAACYGSQGDMLAHFNEASERFRRQPAYDYSRPPHAGTLNYEAWQWPITGGDVSRALLRTVGTHA